MSKFYSLGASILVAMAVAILVWFVSGSLARTEAQGACAAADPVMAYDVTLVQTGKPLADVGLLEMKAVIRVDGKKSHRVYSTTTSQGSSEDESLYDGVQLFRRFDRTGLYALVKDFDHTAQDVGSQGFPIGRATLCADLDSLGAKFVGTDETGKKYEIDGDVQDWTLWVDEDGWLVRADGTDDILLGVTQSYTISGIGEDNEITSPDPPYLEN